MFASTLPITAANLKPAETIVRSNRHFLMLAFVLGLMLLLAGCAGRQSPAPIVSGSGAASAGGTYVVRPGDTLYSIAKKNNISVASLQQLNNINDPTQMSVGQVLRLDSSATVSSAAGGQAVASPVKDGSSASSGTQAASKPGARASDAGLINWGWPANGKVIQGFNSSTKGIDIEGQMGSPVIAAADGKVMYSGNGLRGLGNLILLGHSDGFITAYAHNEKLLVNVGETVKKGQKIATLGDSDTTSPRLHFEIRRKGTPVDPLSYLPVR